MKRQPAVIVVVGALVGVLSTACAYRQTRLDTIDRLDRARFVVCRADIVQQLCPGDPDCAVWAVQMYAAQQPRMRRQWLVDYGCPEPTVSKAEQGAKTPAAGDGDYRPAEGRRH